MPGPTNMDSETEKRVDLKGTPANPGRDPKSLSAQDKKAVGYVALTDGIVIVVIAWVIVLFLYFSLRHFNV